GEMEMIMSRIGLEVKLPPATALEVRALLKAHFPEMTEETWRKFLQGYSEDRRGNARGSTFNSLRRATMFVESARLVMGINGTTELNPAVVHHAWLRLRRVEE